MRANFDSAVADIVLMGVFCERIGTAVDWRAMLRQVWPVMLSTLVVVLGLGCLLGFLLERIARRMARWRGGIVMATVLSSLLFGIAHARGGALLVLLATIAGVHYATAYSRAKRIEGAILTHFVLNAVHFIAFSYPGLNT